MNGSGVRLAAHAQFFISRKLSLAPKADFECVWPIPETG
jgi:hypothetical protein